MIVVLSNFDWLLINELIIIQFDKLYGNGCLWFYINNCLIEIYNFVSRGFHLINVPTYQLIAKE